MDVLSEVLSAIRLQGALFFNAEFSGSRDYVYLLKVVNPGKFEISPAAAGPMYQPATQTTTDPATLEVQQ